MVNNRIDAANIETKSHGTKSGMTRKHIGLLTDCQKG